jgi:phage-related baseplate assembly protein
METDAQLLLRYLLSFDRPAAGTADRYLFEAFSAWPAMLDARVNGFAVHGRRGDTDVVIVGPGGRLATTDEKASVQSAVLAPGVKPEAVSVAVLDAVRLEYSASLVLEVPIGPDAELVRLDAMAAVTSAAAARTVIGGEVPSGYLAGAAYRPNVIKVRDLAPIAVPPDPYTVPVLTALSITVEVRG